MTTIFSFTQCCQLPGKASRTLRQWLAQAGLELRKEPTVSLRRGGPMTFPPRPDRGAEPLTDMALERSAELRERLQVLEQRLATLQEQVTHLALLLAQSRGARTDSRTRFRLPPLNQREGVPVSQRPIFSAFLLIPPSAGTSLCFRWSNIATRAAMW